MSAPCRTRFAPSPTGSLHVGGVRTALYCLLWARKTGGNFVLRIEDTDRARSSEAATRGIVADLEWLGIAWDEGPGIGGVHGPYLQSERLTLYDGFIDQLLKRGHAYEAWESPAELAELRAEAERAKETFRYRRRTYTPDQLAQFESEGRKPVIRLSAPDHAVLVDDAVLGEITLDASELDDIVIRKADGFPTYHFAVVVDDHHMEIDLVLRGQEHLMNTHKHHGVYEALGWTPAPTAHLPLIFSPRGSKMSKRDKAKTARNAAREASKGHPAGWGWLAARVGRGEAEIELFMRKKTDDVGIARDIAQALDVTLPMIEVLDFRLAGYVPEALVNYLALLGWSPGDDRQVLSMQELIDAFSIDRVTRTPARFDPEKLRWLNAEYLRNQLSREAVLDHLDQWLEWVDSPLKTLDRPARGALLEMYLPRIHTLAELDALSRFFFEAPTEYQGKAVQKHLLKGEGDGLRRLSQLRASLTDVGRWEVSSLERTLNALVEATGAKLGKYAQPLRIALSGAAVTPSIYEVLAFLGREEVLARIAACEAHFAPEED